MSDAAAAAAAAVAVSVAAGPVRAAVRAAAPDPGFKNHGVCCVELTHVDSVVGIEGPRTRTPVPCFEILCLDKLNLINPVPGAQSNDDNDRGDLGKLRDAMTTAKPDHNNMPLWREHLAQSLASQFPVLFERYDCLLTGKRELPIVALENQLDVTGEGASPKEREEAAILQRAKDYAREFNVAKESSSNLQWLQDLVDLVAKNRVQLKPKDEFQRGRMYTLSQIFAASVEAIDEYKEPGKRDRLVINAAKKHAIASDNSLSYAQRKSASVELTFAMLEGQVNDPQSTDRERANGKKWLAFLRQKEAEGEKLDDYCDAFLLAISVAMKAHKKYYKLFYQGPPLPCYAPVNNDDIKTASSKALSTGARVATSVRKRKKPVPRKRAVPVAQKKRKRDEPVAPPSRPVKRGRTEPPSSSSSSSSSSLSYSMSSWPESESSLSSVSTPEKPSKATKTIPKTRPVNRKRFEPLSISFPSSGENEEESERVPVYKKRRYE